MFEIEQNVKEIAIRLLGEPNKKLSSNGELRFGSHGSMSVDLEGKWYDHEEMTGGGMVSLIKKYHGDVNEFLSSMGIKDSKPVVEIRESKPPTPLTNNQMHQKAKEAEMVTRYSNDFCVMRFKGKIIRPFSKLPDGNWVMKRPQGKLPLMIAQDEDRDKTLPVLICEGEASAQGGTSLYKGVVVCWHGGVSALEQSDWSQLDHFQDFILFPDNDEVGIACMRELKTILNSRANRTIRIANPPKEWNEKDDLWDSFHRQEGLDILDYIKDNEMDAGYRVVYQNYQSFRDKEYPPMTLMIGDENHKLCHNGELWMLHGRAGSGKSLMTQIMCICLSAGYDFAHYHIDKPHKVLIVDAEMPPVSLQSRFSDIISGTFDGLPEKEELIKRVEQNLVIVSHHDQGDKGLLPINTPEGKEWLYSVVDEVDPEFLVLDNLYTLTSFENPNDPSEFTNTLNPLLLKMRRENRVVWYLHHSSKGGGQSGSMAKEIILDGIICVSVEESEDGFLSLDNSNYETQFKWVWDKSRHIYGKDTMPILWKYSSGILVKCQSDKETRLQTIGQLKNEGLTNKEIGKELEISVSTVDRAIKEAKTMGLWTDEAVF